MEKSPNIRTPNLFIAGSAAMRSLLAEGPEPAMEICYFHQL